MRNKHKNDKKNKIPKSYDDSIVLNFWNLIFSILETLSVFTLIRKILNIFGGKMTHQFVEYWILFNLFLSFISSVLVYRVDSNVIPKIIIVYGILRVFEIIIYQINVLIFHPYRSQLRGEKYKIKSPTRIVVLLFHNYFEIIFWYAGIYMSMNSILGSELSLHWFEYIKLSVLCFSVFDTTMVTNDSILSIVSNIAFTELISGVIMTIVCLARFIGLLPAVESMEQL